MQSYPEQYNQEEPADISVPESSCEHDDQSSDTHGDERICESILIHREEIECVSDGIDAEQGDNDEYDQFSDIVEIVEQ